MVWRINRAVMSCSLMIASDSVQTAVTMRQVTGSMAGVVRGMDSAMKAMDLEKVCVSLLASHVLILFAPM